MPGERIGNSNQYLTISGVVSAPAYSWASDNNTGLYRIGADNIGVAANGAKVLDIATTGLTVTGAFASSNGVSSTLTTDASSSTTGSIITAGGISTQKALWVGTTSNFAGTMTAAAANFSGLITGSAKAVINPAATPTTAATATQLGVGEATNNSTYRLNLGYWVDSGIYRGNIDAITGGTAATLTLNSTGGAVGIGMTPSNVLDITQSQNGASAISLLNSNGGVSARAEIYLNNGTSFSLFRKLGSAFTTSGMLRQDGLAIQENGAGGLTLTTGAAQPVYFGINSVEKMRLDASGNLGIGTSSPQTLLTLNAGSGNDGTGEATYHGLIELAGNYTGTSDLTTVSGIEWKTAYGSGGSGFRQTGLYNSVSGASTLVFAGRQASASWSTLMTLTGTGLLGIGMTPSNVLDITQTQNGLSIAKLTNASAGAASRSIVQISNGTNYAFFGQNGTGYTTSGLDIQDGTRIFAGGNGGLVLQTGAATPIYFAVNNSEAARIGTSGGLLIGTTTENAKLAIVGSTSSQGIFVNSSASGDDAIYAQNGGGLVGSCITCNVGGPTTYLQVFKFQGSAVGTITTNGTTTAYNTTSDYRLKENVQLMTGGLDTIAALKPVTYDWISNGSAGKGFIAHELQAVIPEAVYGEKDALDKDGSIKPQGVDFGKIVPHLVAAMQEQQATIQELTTRLAALENKT